MIHGLVVAKNEEHRYLEDSLRWNRSRFDTLTVVDDGSTDNTVEIALTVATRVIAGLNVTFIDHEGVFRKEAWTRWIEAVSPSTGDWLVSVDADEFVVGDLPGALAGIGGTSASFLIREVWSVNPTMIRTDGWWGNGRNARCIRAEAAVKGGDFMNRSMGSGSIPRVPGTSPVLVGSEILHFGYTTEADRREKHRRYSSRKGHSKNHVASILQTPTLEEWTGEHP